ncbi:MAG: rod-binding protein [Humidesulfovibrio sp.]|nr:rod-binding protein [Humidesulfovibrio sp.]
MTDISQDASVASKKAQESELIALRRQMDRLKNDLTPGQGSQQKLRKACADFEAVFLSKMWEQMRATIPKGDPLHSPQEDMYRSMFDRDFSEKLASDGGIGLGDMLYKQLKDKIKNTAKTPGKVGIQILESGAANAKNGAVGSMAGLATDSSTLTRSSAKTTTGSLAKPMYKTPERPMGSGGRPGNIAGSAPVTNPMAANTNIITSPRAYESLSTPSSASSSALSGPAPVRPASVPGEVMADVEALARRIESNYDQRQLENSQQPAQESGAETPSGYGTTGYGTSGYGSGQSQTTGYDQKGRASSVGTGRKFATTG